MKKSETPTAPLSAAEKEDLLALAGSPELRTDLRAVAAGGHVSFEDYVAFVTAFAKMAGHPRRPVRPVNDAGFKL